MKQEKISGFNGRRELVDQLIFNYRNKSAAQVIILTGASGSGKSFVVNKVAAECDRFQLMRAYINRGDSFVSLSHISRATKLDSLSLSIGSSVMTVGIGASVQREESQYNHIKALLSAVPNTTLLFCLDDTQTASSAVKSILRILLSHSTELEQKLSVKLYFLITDYSFDPSISLALCSETLTHIELEPYRTADILEYYKSKHLGLLITPRITDNICEIQKICNGNLSLANFLFVDIAVQNSDYFKALEQVVQCRLSQLKKVGQRKDVSEAEMEDIILSSALSIQRFSTTEISCVTQRASNTVANSLDIARDEAIIEKDVDCFYDFSCPQVKSALEKQSIEKRKERLLYYYQYYTENEQDEYFLRAFYLAKYFGEITPQVFALLGLALTSCFSKSDGDELERINKIVHKYGYPEQITLYEKLLLFYEKLLMPSNSANFYALNDLYHRLSGASFEAPLRAELVRAYFHYLYRTHAPTSKTLNLMFNECLPFAEQEVELSDFLNPIGIKPEDETIVRLNVLYSIAPYLLDVRNDVQSFTRLYQISRTISQKCHSKSANGLAQYIENVFNRKAFLFVNQTQCGPYYESAKAYFSRNQIWDEVCMTLVCQAGTDIVIQKYAEAQSCCTQALEVVDRYAISLPQPAKLQNNYLIAAFLETEEQSKNQRVRLSKAKQTISQLKKLLTKEQCATEFVILTNICSLCLYCGDDKGYIRHKHILEHLMSCTDVSNIADEELDDFYRYYFAWFEVFRTLRDEKWDLAEEMHQKICGFVPALFQKQEIFWKMKEQALADLIKNHIAPTPYDFCINLVKINRREDILSRFFFRGLMLSDLQYTSYN